jgi:suppressor of fused protein SUFU
MSIFRHERASEKWELDGPGAENIAAITEHVEKFWGPVGTVWHEIVSDYVHIDVLPVPPTPDKPFHTFITSGMSDRPMKAAEQQFYGELLISLPADWPVDDTSTKDERNWWPIGQLKYLARFPHQYDTWLDFGHKVPNGDPPQPFAENTAFCCSLICRPVLADEGCDELVITSNKAIHFFSVIPIYRHEMDFALEHSSSELIQRLSNADVTELLDIHRQSVCHEHT